MNRHCFEKIIWLLCSQSCWKGMKYLYSTETLIQSKFWKRHQAYLVIFIMFIYLFFVSLCSSWICLESSTIIPKEVKHKNQQYFYMITQRNSWMHWCHFVTPDTNLTQSRHIYSGLFDLVQHFTALWQNW